MDAWSAARGCEMHVLFDRSQSDLRRAGKADVELLRPHEITKGPLL